VDTTVMPEAIAQPTDSRLLDKSRKHLVKAVEDNGPRLRQNYNRVAHGWPRGSGATHTPNSSSA
jgi:IS5 family transposase